MYLGSIVDNMPVVSTLLGDGAKGYMTDTKTMLAKVNDLLVAMEADRNAGDDSDDDDTEGDDAEGDPGDTDAEARE